MIPGSISLDFIGLQVLFVSLVSFVVMLAIESFICKKFNLVPTCKHKKSRFKSKVGCIGSYTAKVLSTLQGVDERTGPDVPEEQEDYPTHILLISRKKHRNR